jgi:predicted RNase H-like HicB family nuclease
MTRKYEIILYWSDEDHIFVAEVPELPGCFAHGKTQNAALKHVQEAIDLWIITAKEDGIEIPVPKGRKLMYA